MINTTLDLSQMVTKKDTLGEASVINGANFRFDIAQNTNEWDDIRKGKITASKAKTLLTSALTNTGKQAAGSVGNLSKGAVTYAHKIAAQRYDPNVKSLDSFYSASMEQGHEQEDNAAFEFVQGSHYRNHIIKDCGFIQKSSYIGASPDKLIYDERGDLVAGLEIKTCKYEIQHNRMLDINPFIKEHEPQCQFTMWCSGLDKWILTSYCPTYGHPKDRILWVPIEKDQSMHELFEERCKEMNYLINSIILQLKNRR